MLAMFRSTLKVMGMAIVPAVFLMFVGCSSDSSPTGSGDKEPTPPEIKTPRSLIVQKITVTSFPANKSNGDNWDWDPFSSTPRRPDIYVKLGEKNGSAEFRSITKDNARSGTSYNVSTKHKSSSKSLPYEMNYKDPYSYFLFDDDGILKHEQMGSKTVYPSDLYRDDNATNFSTTLICSNGVRIVISGVWTY